MANEVKTINGMPVADTTAREEIEKIKQGSGTETPGADGYSPIANVEQTDTGAVITIIDKNGTTTATITNGKDGKSGENGADGNDGYSPEVSIMTIAGGYRISITDINGTHYFNVFDGTDGQNGTSVTVSNVSESTEDGGSNVVTFSDGKTLTVKNGKTGAAGANGSDANVTKENIKSALGYTPADAGDVAELSEAIADQQTAIDGKQPKGDYALSSELAAETTAREQAVADLNARLGQQTLLIAEGETVEDALAWLETNGDKTKAYLMPDDFFYMWRQTTEVGGVAYTNLLPTATDTDRTTIYGEDYDGDGVADGYLKGKRLSSSGSVSTATSNMAATGFITAKPGDTLRAKGLLDGGANLYVIAYNNENTKTGHIQYNINQVVNGIITFELTTAAFGENFNAVRLCAGENMSDVIITVNQEINENGGTVIVEKWASTGHTLTSSDFSAAIANLINITDTHTTEINELKEAVESGKIGELTDAEKIEKIKVWDKPVYDSAPVTLLSDDRVKPDLTTDDRTIPAIYAKYRALMAQYPRIITETNLGACTSSDTFSAVDILRFDIKEPDGLTTAAYNPDNLHETKPKIILMSGVHTEWVGVWGLYYAIEEIVTNPDFDDIRRNAHIIVVPCSNPFVLSNQTVDGWTTSHVNANGVAIHNNFGVDHRTSGSVGEYNYGGTAPYSELETQYIDKIMSDNPDAIAFVSCHNNDYSTEFGTPVIWASSAAYHMCNVVFRLIDKISKAWIDKYGETLTNAIDTIRADFPALQEGDYRLGRATMSSSAGTEQKNALKYGIQGVNVEISRMMKVFSGNTDGTSEVMTHGAEVYANLMRTVLAAYSYTDKEAYYK